MTTFKEMLPIKSFYVILRESKIDILQKTSMKPEEKEEIIEFIKKYGDSALKEFNWNKPETIEYDKLKKDIDTWLQNRSLKNNNNPKIFENKELFYFLHEDNEAWYYLPLSHDACLAANNYQKNADQSDNPDSPWCIGWDGTEEHWDYYINDIGIAFILQIKKNPKDNKDIKYMYQIYHEYLREKIIEELGTYITFWDQNNEKEHPSKNEYINSHADEIYKLFFEKSDTDIRKFNMLPEEYKKFYKEQEETLPYRNYNKLKYFLDSIDEYRKYFNLPEKDKKFILKIFDKMKTKLDLPYDFHISSFVGILEDLKKMNNSDFELFYIGIKYFGIGGYPRFLKIIEKLNNSDKQLYLTINQEFKENCVRPHYEDYDFPIDFFVKNIEKLKNLTLIDFKLLGYWEYLSDIEEYFLNTYYLSKEEKTKLLRKKALEF